MWYLQALGAAISLAVLRELASRDTEPPLLMGERTENWSFQDISRCRTLWLDSLLYGQVSKSPDHPEIYLHLLAESAFAAAWSALDFWDVYPAHKSRLEANLKETAQFLETLKPDRERPGVFQLRERLRKISPSGEKKTEVWAYLIGHWLETTCGVKPLSALEELKELGWALASFGLNYWTRGPVFYRKDGREHRLIQPFSQTDAFDLYGPFDPVPKPSSEPSGERLAVASLVTTKGLKSPPVWKLEALLGGIPGVLLTRTGHVHRQFAGADLPEWFEAVELVYQPGVESLKEILKTFWHSFSTSGDLIFYTDESQKHHCLEAWNEFRASTPTWAIPHGLELRPCNWFEPAEPKHQKTALQGVSLLRNTLQRIDLRNSHLATKVNAFAAGYGQDEEVVVAAARYGLEDGLTLALRSIRYFSEPAQSP